MEIDQLIEITRLTIIKHASKNKSKSSIFKCMPYERTLHCDRLFIS